MSKKKPAKKEDSKLFAFLGILLTIIGFVLVLAFKRDDKYAIFYAKQGLILFVTAVIVWLLNMILNFIPIIGKLANLILVVILVVIWIIALINSLSGKMKETPIVGYYGRNIKI